MNVNQSINSSNTTTTTIKTIFQNTTTLTTTILYVYTYVTNGKQKQNQYTVIERESAEKTSMETLRGRKRTVSCCFNYYCSCRCRCSSCW